MAAEQEKVLFRSMIQAISEDMKLYQHEMEDFLVERR